MEVDDSSYELWLGTFEVLGNSYEYMFDEYSKYFSTLIQYMIVFVEVLFNDS